MSEKINVEWNTKKSYVCVDYPAIVQNDDKMLKTLGGIEELSRIVENPNLRLPLKFRPDDAYCKPMYGDRDNSTRVLLRVKRTKAKAENNSNLNVEMLGVIGTSYKFKSMADFEYLPMTSSASGGYVGAYEQIAPTKMHDLSWMNQPAPMFIPPITFSRIDRPCDYDFSKAEPIPLPPDESNADSPEKNDTTAKRVGNRKIESLRKSRCRFAINVKFTSVEVPDKPTPECERNILEYGDVSKKLIKEVRRLFEKRPVWNKLALMSILKCSDRNISVILPYVSYHVLTGPWRTMYVKYGYDPRKDPSAKIYQTIDLRLKRFGDAIPLYSKKRSHLFGRKGKISGPISEKTWVIHTKDLKRKEQFGSSPLPEFKQKAKYSYYKGVIPMRRQSLLQLCDIYLDEVQTLLRVNDGREMLCDSKDGWFDEGFVAKCRTLLARDIKRTLRRGPKVMMSPHLKLNKTNDSDTSASEYEDEEEETL